MNFIKYLLVGFFFGIVLTKAEAVSWYRIYEMFQFQSFHMYGIIMTAIATGLIGVQIIKRNKLKDIEETAIYAGKKTEVITLDKITANKATNNSRQVFAQVVGLTINESNDGGLQLSLGGRGLDPNRTANFNTRQNDYDISADVLGYPESYYATPTEALETR